MLHCQAGEQLRQKHPMQQQAMAVATALLQWLDQLWQPAAICLAPQQRLKQQLQQRHQRRRCLSQQQQAQQQQAVSAKPGSRALLGDH
jgi:hypothetical protein